MYNAFAGPCKRQSSWMEPLVNLLRILVERRPSRPGERYNCFVIVSILSYQSNPSLTFEWHKLANIKYFLNYKFKGARSNHWWYNSGGRRSGTWEVIICGYVLLSPFKFTFKQASMLMWKELIRYCRPTVELSPEDERTQRGLTR